MKYLSTILMFAAVSTSVHAAERVATATNAWVFQPGTYSGNGSLAGISLRDGTTTVECKFEVTITATATDTGDLKFTEFRKFSPNSPCGLDGISDFYVAFDGTNYAFYANGRDYPNQASCLAGYCSAVIFYGSQTARTNYFRSGNAVELFGTSDDGHEGVRVMWHYAVTRVN